MRFVHLLLGIELLAVAVLPVSFPGGDAGLEPAEQHTLHRSTPAVTTTIETKPIIEADVANHAPPVRWGLLTAAERNLVEWAEGRFAIVGLRLPDVEVVFHDDTESCGGHPGRFRGSADRRIVAICVPDSGTFHSQLQRRRTLVHELAHAWDYAHLDSEDHARLLTTLDAVDWYGPDAEWDERGVERFAETIVWGLYDQRRRPTMIDVACAELHADFIAITGSRAPGPLEPVCEPTVTLRSTTRAS